MTLQTVLVALDRSSQAPAVFAQALAEATAHQSNLLIVHTLHPEPNVDTNPFLGVGTLGDVRLYGTLKHLQQERLAEEMQQAQEWLQSYRERAIAQGIDCDIDCAVGDPKLHICNQARSQQADLIVLGRRGHRGLKEVVLGSVSNYVIHHATCSVLVVQGNGITQGDAALVVQEEGVRG